MDYLHKADARATAEQLRAEALRNWFETAFRGLRRLSARVATTVAERRLVAELSHLDDWALRDIGLDRAQLHEFARRSVANENRRRDAA